MVSVRIFCLLILCFFFTANKNETRDSYDRAQVINLLRLYASTIESYSKCGLNGEYQRLQEVNDRMDDVMRLFGSNNGDAARKTHACDLFRNLKTDLNLYEYLLKIKDTPYRNRIIINYRKYAIDDRIHYSESGRSFVWIETEKYLKFNSDTMSTSEIIKIDITTNKYIISGVVFPEANMDCSFPDIIDDKESKASHFKSLADSEFNNHHYYTADNYYLTASQFNADDNSLGEGVKECNNNATFFSLVNEANGYFNNEDYETAMGIYENLRKNYPKNNGDDVYYTEEEDINRNIKLCKMGIINKYYAFNVSRGDEYYRKGFYSRAAPFYRLSLLYKPNSKYSRLMIKRCNNGDENRILNDLAYARSLLSRRLYNNIPEIVNIFIKYEKSGLLTGQDFYNMSVIFNNKEYDLSRVLTLTQSERSDIAKKYCLEAISLNYQPAINLWNTNFNNTVVTYQNGFTLYSVGNETATANNNGDSHVSSGNQSESINRSSNYQGNKTNQNYSQKPKGQQYSNNRPQYQNSNVTSPNSHAYRLEPQNRTTVLPRTNTSRSTRRSQNTNH